MAFNLLALYTTSSTSTATCTVNGQPASCKAAAGIIGGFFLVFAIVGLINFVFWIIDLVHLIQHEDVPNRVLWIILITLIPFASWVYLFGPRRKYNKAHKNGGAPTQQTGQPQPSAPVSPAPTTTPDGGPSVVVSPQPSPTPTAEPVKPPDQNQPPTVTTQV